MEFQTLMIRTRPQLHNMSYRCRWREFHFCKAFYFLMVLLHTLLILTSCEPCSPNGLQTPAEYDSCGSYRVNRDTEFVDAFAGNPWSGFVLNNSFLRPSLDKAADTAEADELVLRNWKSHATASGTSILVENEVVFSMIQVGSHCSQWITVTNPSKTPVVMQLVLNSWEVVDECKTPETHLHSSLSSSIVGSSAVAPRRYGFSVADNAVTEALVLPFGRASFGPILFQPAARCRWRSSALIRNNLSGVEWLSLSGFGGLRSLVLLDESGPVANLDFKLNSPSLLNLSSPGMLYHMEDKPNACSVSLSKEVYAKNVGDFPLEVKRIEVSGTKCGLDGFVIHSCEGFALEPGESIKLVISYQTDFSFATIQRDLELALATGILVIPMKASLPIHMLNFCKKSLFWTRMKKFLVTVLLASIFLLVLWCIFPHVVAFGFQDYVLRSGKSCIGMVSHAGKSSRTHHSQKHSGQFVFSSQLNGLLRSIGEGEAQSLEYFGAYADSQAVTGEQGLTDNNLHQSPERNCPSDTPKKMVDSSSTPTKSPAIQSSDKNESPKTGNLCVKVGKDKGRRRKKKKNNATAVAGVFEVSSSHSGNSTPSSPLSPVSSSTPRRTWPQSGDVDLSVKLRNPVANVANQQHGKCTHSDYASQGNNLEPEFPILFGNKNACFPSQEKPAAPKRLAGKSHLLPSATFLCAEKSAPLLICFQPLLASTSRIAPHVRAPGSKLQDKQTVKTEEKTGMEEKYNYDIWGHHLLTPPFIGRSKEVMEMPSQAIQNRFDSFFVRGPPIPITNYKVKPVSCSDQKD